jgi:hypothetical protein
MCDLYKTIFLEWEMINKNDVFVVSIATMTFQYGRHFLPKFPYDTMAYPPLDTTSDEMLSPQQIHILFTQPSSSQMFAI